MSDMNNCLDLAPLLAAASTGLLGISPARLSVGDFWQPLVDTVTFRVAELRGSLHHLSLSRGSQLVLYEIDEKWNPQILISRNTTIGLQNFQLPDMAASSGPTDGAYIVHYRTDELLVKQHIVSDGQSTSPIKEGAKHTQSLSCLSS
jgi:hypothetical protein